MRSSCLQRACCARKVGFTSKAARRKNGPAVTGSRTVRGANHFQMLWTGLLEPSSRGGWFRTIAFQTCRDLRPTKAQRARLDLDSADANEVRKHLELTKSKWVRRLVPEELERLNGFPAGHTEGPTDGRRAFFMGNALVCGVVQRIGAELENLNDQSGGS